MLVKSTDPVLHTATTPVTEFNAQLQEFCVSMVDEMRKENGIGLAAPQIGDSRSIFVMETKGTIRHVINPRLVRHSDVEETQMEGCLSYPEMIIPVTRPASIEVQYWTATGEEVNEYLEGIEARCFQHELDHLRGICFVDGLSQLKLELARKRGRKNRRRN